MIAPVPERKLDDRHLARIKQRCRVILLLDAAEQVGITPLPSPQLHAFAYLADVLSPVWNLVPFDGKIYKAEGGPHYPDLQNELDCLVVQGLVQVSNLRYDTTDRGARIAGSYALNFSSKYLERILGALGARTPEIAIDPDDRNLHTFLVELAGALATLPEDQIETAVAIDVTYRAEENLHNVVDFAEWTNQTTGNLSWRTVERFHAFLPEESRILPGEKLYLYAAYLGRAMHAS